MSHEIATLVHPIESSKPAAHAQGIRSIVLLEVPRLLEGRPYLVSVAIYKVWRDKAFQAKKTAGVFVLISPMSVSRLCRLVKESSRLSTGRRELSWCMALYATSDAVGMTLEMTLVNPVQWGVAIRRTRLTPCASPMFCSVIYFPAICELFSLSILPRKKKFSKTRNKMLQFLNFP